MMPSLKPKETKMSAYGIWNEIAEAKPETIFRNVTLEEFRDFHWTSKDSFAGEAVEEVFTEWTSRPGVAWVGAIGSVADAMAPWNAIGVVAVTFSGRTVEDVESGNGHFAVTFALSNEHKESIANLYGEVHGGGHNVSNVGLKDAPRIGIPFVNFSPIADNLSWIEWHYARKGDKLTASGASAGHWWTLEEVVREVVNAVDRIPNGVVKGVAGFAVDPENWKAE